MAHGAGPELDMFYLVVLPAHVGELIPFFGGVAPATAARLHGHLPVQLEDTTRRDVRISPHGAYVSFHTALSRSIVASRTLIIAPSFLFRASSAGLCNRPRASSIAFRASDTQRRSAS